MKRVPVAPAPASVGRAASLLEFYRQAMERLALLRLTERDPDLLDCIERAYGELLASGAVVARKMRDAGLLERSERIAGLHRVDNHGDNRPQAGLR